MEQHRVFFHPLKNRVKSKARAIQSAN